jgi:hypothetical protein
MKDLVWELFLMLREVMPNNEINTKRQHEWAAKFHELETPTAPETLPSSAFTSVEPAIGDDDVDEPEDEHPAAHAARPKVGTRKKR